MPSLGYRRAAYSAVPNSGLIVTTSEGLRLRRVGADGKYDPAAVLVATGEYATFPNLAASGLSSLWSFDVDADTVGANAGTIDFRLSADDGVTWRFWSGAAWAVAGANDWSSAAVVRTNIATFPVGGVVRGIRLQVRLRPGAENTSPVLRDAWFTLEYSHDPVVDVIRSVCTHLSLVTYPVYVVERADGTNKVALAATAIGFAVDVGKPITVYDETTDPGHGTNLFSSYAAGLVTMTAAPPAGRSLWVGFSGGLTVTPVPRAIFYDAVVPSVQVSLSVQEDGQQSGGAVSESNVSSKTARSRAGPRHLAIQLSVVATDKDEERSVLLGGILRRTLNDDGITSLATAVVWDVADVSGVVIRPSFSNRVHAVTVSGTLWVREDSRKFVSETLVQQINARISGALPYVWYDENQWVAG